MDHSWKSSEMYESYFRFKDTPFRLSADEKFRYAHKNYLRASAYLAYALDQGEGFVMITGQPGSGKTTLIRDVISELDEARYNTLNLVTSQLQAEELLRKVALEYGFPAENANKATLLTTIQKHLSTLHDQGKRSILFLDEAQNLSRNGLEELRLLSNLQQGKHSLLQIILVGHNELRKFILAPDLTHVQQRLIANCQIEPLSQEQTREYILHRLEHVGWQSDPKIEDEVFQLIHTVSKGVPRNINHLMSHLLLFACLEEKHHLIDEDALTVIEELIDQQRITLAGDESIESFAKRYRAEKQQVVRQAAANLSSISLTPQEQGSWNHEPQQNLSTTHRIDSEILTPVNDNIAPVNDTGLKAPDSDWFLWHEDAQGDSEDLATKENDNSKTDQAPIDKPSEVYVDKNIEPELTLPNADDIWNSTVESTDVDNFFPDNRRQKSNFSVETPKIQSTTQPVGNQVAKDREHRWGGVWFMSSGDRRQGSNGSIKAASILKQDHSIAVNENLSMPSVWVEDCPDIVAPNHDTPTHQHPKPGKSAILKRSIIHVIGLVFIGVLVMLTLQRYPEKISQLFHILETRLPKLGQATEVWPARREENSPLTQNDDREGKQDRDSSNTALPDLNQTEQREIAVEPPMLEWTDAFKSQSNDSGTTTSRESPPEKKNPDITSHNNIKMASRYNVYFDFNKSVIPSAYEPLLKSIRDKMLLNENNFLKITGYADSQGNGNYNYRLSLKRAEAVREYFTIRGIADERLQVTAVGSVKRAESRLETLDIRKLIRRVEVILFPK
jgi:type II secretory pathway predicted ATPase ExeA/outer membrane protein OmpA-like peptidoglycan-associated protein